MLTEKLIREQKEAVFLLSIGTFLEYFDLMFYIHMAVFLNELFFPQADPLVAKLLAAFAFCSTYVFRPIGGFIIGWIGDHIGRKNTVIITTLTMAFCCITMASIRTYAEIGITAAVVMIVCRMLQGFSSLGEAVGAELYLTETLKQPNSYISTGVVGISARIGGLFALIIASLSMAIGLNWRLAFWIGACIVLVGFIASVRLRETPEFINFKLMMEKRKELVRNMPEPYRRHQDLLFNTKKPDKKTILSYFMMFVSNSVCFYITFIYCGNFMKESLGMTPEQVINQNLRVSIVTIIGTIITTAFFVKRYHPLKIAKVQIMIYALFLPAIPYWLGSISSLTSLSLFQFALFFLALNPFCMQIPCFKHIPMEKRFTTLATTFGVATALANVIVAFSLIPLTTYLGYYGLCVILAPVTLGVLLAVNHVRRLEIKAGLYHDYPNATNSANDQGIAENMPEKYELPIEYASYNLNCDYSQTLLVKISDVIKHGDRSINLKLIKKAIIFAKKWHDGQTRKTGEPYYAHPLAVACRAAEYNMTTDVIIAAILHDVVEDSACTVELIEKEFNHRIAEIVQRLTRIVSDENNNEIKLSVKEIMHNLIKADDTEAMLIKVFDREHNLETIDGLKKYKQHECAAEALENIMRYVALAVDKLNINNKLQLEEKLYKYCKSILGPLR